VPDGPVCAQSALGNLFAEEVCAMAFPFRRDASAIEQHRPPIDLRVPQDLETATFAVG